MGISRSTRCCAPTAGHPGRMMTGPSSCHARSVDISVPHGHVLDTASAAGGSQELLASRFGMHATGPECDMSLLEVLDTFDGNADSSSNICVGGDVPTDEGSSR
eukprot:TRINITY_DN74485_c0_g1_i1.p3 TRINITY_DN74485_c0_g1~~TRINITY_DN74485_c0_g1_i1.p3  ORF type:complete len:104 (-),score=11.64 TRINITY_DN74485_c0_g1_i1:103-414(-)